MKLYHFIFFLIISISCRSTSDHLQTQSNELLIIDNKKVSADEFLYSFNKSYQNSEDSITAEEIKDYLELFINYKLKVAAARQYGYDTTAAYKNELSQYQEQVKSSYRSNQNIIDSLVQEAYERMQYEVKASHILLRLDKNASPDDTVKAYNRIMEIREMEEDFNALAKKYSEDPSARQNAGDLGYFTAFQMVYPFETAAYETPEGEISMPVRTQYGYHIVKTEDKKPLIQKVVHQLFLPSDKENYSDKLYKAQEMLMQGMPPQQLMESALGENFNYSLISSAQIKRLPSNIQEAVDHLNQPNEVSDPVETQQGGYIFALKEIEKLPALETIRKQLERMVSRSERLEVYEDQYLNQLLNKYNFNLKIKKKELPHLLKDSTLTDVVLFTLNNEEFSLKEFKGFIKDQNDIMQSFDNYLQQQVQKLEDEALIAQNQELKWLLKEYEEGMLLFAIMEDSIWNKAVKDSVGLHTFVEEQLKVNNNNEVSLENKGKVIAAYQEFLEDQWIRRLREGYKVNVNQEVLEEIYEKLIN